MKIKTTAPPITAKIAITAGESFKPPFDVEFGFVVELEPIPVIVMDIPGMDISIEVSMEDIDPD